MFKTRFSSHDAVLTFHSPHTRFYCIFPQILQSFILQLLGFTVTLISQKGDIGDYAAFSGYFIDVDDYAYAADLPLCVSFPA